MSNQANATPFTVGAAIRRARVTLSSPPELPHIERPEPKGDLVAEFALPIELCPTTNRTRQQHWWCAEKTKKALWSLMWIQAGARIRREPLPGRPQVLCVRFSSTEPDRFSDWAKLPVDMLCAPRGRAKKRRLGMLVDDSPRHVDLHQWWEPASPGMDAVYIQVRTGVATAEAAAE